MARFVLTADVVGAPYLGAYGLYPKGTTIADCAANAVGDDIVWPRLLGLDCDPRYPFAPSHRHLAPLDAAAQAMMPGSKITTAKGVAGWPAARDPIAGPIGDKL